MSRTMPLDQLNGVKIAVRHTDPTDMVTVGVCHIVRLGPGPRLTVLLRPKTGDDLYLHADVITWMVPVATDWTPQCEVDAESDSGRIACSLQPHTGTDHVSIGYAGHTLFTAEEVVFS